jgi:hypothetical protein
MKIYSEGFGSYFVTTFSLGSEMWVEKYTLKGLAPPFQRWIEKYKLSGGV